MWLFFSLLTFFKIWPFRIHRTLADCVSRILYVRDGTSGKKTEFWRAVIHQSWPISQTVSFMQYGHVRSQKRPPFLSGASFFFFLSKNLIKVTPKWMRKWLQSERTLKLAPTTHVYLLRKLQIKKMESDMIKALTDYSLVTSNSSMSSSRRTWTQNHVLTKLTYVAYCIASKCDSLKKKKILSRFQHLPIFFLNW